MMKKIIFTFLLIAFSFNSHAQDKNKKVVFEIKGNCEMCQNRIEKTATKIIGVKYATWDVLSKELTIIINETKCSPLDVKLAIANAGHDSEEAKAPKKVYDRLPACCKYRDPNSVHMNHDGN